MTLLQNYLPGKYDGDASDNIIFHLFPIRYYYTNCYVCKAKAKAGSDKEDLAAEAALTPLPKQAAKPKGKAKGKAKAPAKAKAEAGLGCSKCRYLPRGCTQCRNKQEQQQ